MPGNLQDLKVCQRFIDHDWFESTDSMHRDIYELSDRVQWVAQYTEAGPKLIYSVDPLAR